MTIAQIHENRQVEHHENVENWHASEATLDSCAIFSRALRDKHNQAIAQNQGITDHEKYFSSWLNSWSRIRTNRHKIAQHEKRQQQTRIERPRHELRVYRNMIRVHVESAIEQPSTGLAKRGEVKEFSRKSRKRMIDLMNSQKDGVPRTFVTLTYADEALFRKDENGKSQPITTADDWKRHVEVLRKRIQRLIPDVRAIWRIELQRRKSGEFFGTTAPHFHLLVWDVSPDDIVAEDEKLGNLTFARWLQQTWFEIVGTGLDKHYEHGTHISEIKSSRHAMFYVSKYVAKEDSPMTANFAVGRRWGRIGKFDTTATLIQIMDERTCNHFKRLLRAYMKSVERDYYKRVAKSRSDKGFTVYGVGDENWDLWNSHKPPLVLQMVRHACDLSQLE